MARLGGLRLGTTTVDGVDRQAHRRRPDAPRAPRRRAPRRRGAVVSSASAATLRSSISGSSWLFTRADGISSLYRWIPWISRRTPFDRPNHGDPFVTPVSPSSA